MCVRSRAHIKYHFITTKNAKLLELRINLDIAYTVNYNVCVACRWWQWEMASEECSSAPAPPSAISFSFAKRSSASNSKKEGLGRGEEDRDLVFSLEAGRIKRYLYCY